MVQTVLLKKQFPYNGPNLQSMTTIQLRPVVAYVFTKKSDMQSLSFFFAIQKRCMPYMKIHRCFKNKSNSFSGQKDVRMLTIMKV